MPSTILIWGALVPTLLAGTVLIIGLRPWRAPNSGAPNNGAWAAGLAVGCGYVAGHWGMAGGPLSASTDISQMLLYLAVGGATIGLFEAFFRPLAAVRWGVRVVACAFTAWLLLRPLLGMGWNSGQSAFALATVTLTLLLVWSVLDGLAATEPGPSLALALAALAAAGSATLVLSATATTGQLAGVLIGTLGAAFLVLWKLPGEGRLRSAVPPIALLLVGQWTIGLFYAEMPKPSFALLALAPVGLLVVRLPPLRRARAVIALVARLLATIIPATAAAGTAAAHYFAEPAARPSQDGDDASYGY